jgi:hypothetical protein
MPKTRSNYNINYMSQPINRRETERKITLYLQQQQKQQQVDGWFMTGRICQSIDKIYSQSEETIKWRNRRTI